jgi:3-hydroxyisobutyrate dehydrogenase
MVMNLLKAGFEVSVFNRTKERRPLLAAGAKSASSLQELMETCDVVLTMLSNDAAVKEVFETKGLLSAASAGKTIINMSTVARKPRVI